MNYIEYGYDRHVRCWCAIVFDKNGNQLKSSYTGNLSDCLSDIEDFKIDFNTKVVTRIKAY